MSNLSEAAVLALRFEIRGWKTKDLGKRLIGLRELAAAGIMEKADGAYRFTPWGLEHREQILAREEERIERGRSDPPEGDLSDAATALVRRIVAERVEVTDADRAAFRELAAARVMTLGSSFAGGPESAYRLTYRGWRMRSELAGAGAEVA